MQRRTEITLSDHISALKLRQHTPSQSGKKNRTQEVPVRQDESGVSTERRLSRVPNDSRKCAQVDVV
jgi:hypothetical protein